jgi:DNA-binding response OmpR family regulator
MTELGLAHVLVIDDNERIRRLISTTLGGLVAQVREAPDAIAGLGVWLEMRPHLVLVDYEMPQLDGATFIRILRAQEAVLGVRTATLMITGHTDVDRVMAARDAGADGYMVKPLQADVILARATKCLEAAAARRAQL